ncbi:GTP-dependent dephospho-CoA kinase family protein [Natrialba sp. INN-245]|uniref:GTP-dependent dephospho-CoA kinase family protein n=1 Tax=Natrialba sp. INN-245 TaxID=2690967 RepID=UPI0031B6B0AC
MAREDRPPSARSGSANGGHSDEPESLLFLPEELRGEFKEPMGPLETDAAVLLESVDGTLIAVGDVVTDHLLRAGREPDVALVDERTKRRDVDEEIRERVAAEPDLEAENPPAEISADAVSTLLEALALEEPTTVLVDGEEDLLALPAIVAAPEGASVVYGQPDEGMVHVRVTEETKSEMRALLEGFEGDTEQFWRLLEE